MHKVCSVIISALLASCAFSPAVEKHQRYARHCDMYTKQLTLETVPLEGHECKDANNAEQCALIVALGLPVVTFVVSGSIVLIGNTLHWVEFHGSCERGAVNEYVRSFKQTLAEE
ncbi:hypothetical protein CHH28_08995 [Bacterioplanes sanyensis]|uniref:Lipoprotein n=1 Tax=Bacterioplanes sanyensis TaxID=1249553 RepID=A0A222FIC7_9GAMM|nr:hypothetical protein [Bacterioplanes sanyensis]ASP38807.1 hypothetical protein CHH28_08995 [Bacterioplanes sanyensis]